MADASTFQMKLVGEIGPKRTATPRIRSKDPATSAWVALRRWWGSLGRRCGNGEVVWHIFQQACWRQNLLKFKKRYTIDEFHLNRRIHGL